MSHLICDEYLVSDGISDECYTFTWWQPGGVAEHVHGIADVLRALHRAKELYTEIGRLGMAAKQLRVRADTLDLLLLSSYRNGPVVCI